MLTFIFICCFLNLAAGFYLVIASQTVSQGLYGAICLVISTILFIGGAIVYKLDSILTLLKKR